VEKHANVQIIDGADHNLRGSNMTIFEIVKALL
jgi:hypothetical protein